MEKLPGVSIISKDYLYQLIYVILNNDLDDKMIFLLQKLRDNKVFDIMLYAPELVDYKLLLNKVTEKKLQGLNKAVIEETLGQNEKFNKILNEVNLYCKQNVPNTKHVTDILMDKIKAVALYDFFVHYANYINPNKLNELADIFDNVMKDIESLYQKMSEDYNVTSREYTSEESVEARFKERLLRIIGKSKIKVISTGISLLDATFRNMTGMESGEIYIIGAPYGTGKTRFVVRLGLNMYLRGATVYHITIENKLEDVEEMYDTALLGISSEELLVKIKKAVYKGELEKDIEKELQEIKQSLKDIYKSRPNKILFKKFHPYKVNTAMIKNWIATEISKGNPAPDVIIVDHMDIMIPTSDNATDNLFQKGERVAGELKTLAEELNAVVITPSQMNREGATSSKKQVETGGESISRSMAKNELAGFIMTLNQTRDEAINNYARLFVDKNRFGLSKVAIPIKFDKTRIEIEPVTDDTELLNFPERIREHVRILLSRLNGDEDVEIQNVDEIEDYNMEELVEDIYHITGEEEEEEIVTQYIEDVSQFMREVILYTKNNNVQDINIETDEKNVYVTFNSSYQLVGNRVTLHSKLLDAKFKKPEIYDKLKQNKVFSKIIEIFNVDNEN